MTTSIPTVSPGTVKEAGDTQHQRDTTKLVLDFPKKVLNYATALRLAFKTAMEHDMGDCVLVLRIAGPKILYRFYKHTHDGKDRRPTYDVPDGPAAQRP